MKKLTMSVMAAAIWCVSMRAAAQPCPGLIINEVRLDQFGADADEFAELRGTPSASLNNTWYIVIGDVTGAPVGTQSGGVELAINLTGQSLGTDGLFVIAKETFTLGTADLVIPSGSLVGGELFENSDNVTHMLVTGFTGQVGQDLDTNNDGVLDVTPWTAIVFSIAILEEPAPDGATQEHYYSSFTVGPDGAFSPFLVYLCADECEARVGDIDIDVDDTPGAANPTCGTGGGDELRINEIRIDETGTDNNEYFELSGPPATSLNGMTYIVLGDGTVASGVIESVTSLAGQSIAADGFFLVAESTMTLGTADLTVPGANPLNFENADNVTHLLVTGFTGTLNQDLDTNDDGVLDVTPWTAVVDAVGVIIFPNPPPAGSEFEYATPLGFPTVGPEGTFAPGHVYRCEPDRIWTIGQFNPVGGQDTAGNPNIDCGLGAPCGSSLAGSCFTIHANPNCNNAECCEAVCRIDPDCCTVAWDQACVTQAQITCQTCGDAATGSCFTADGTPYCSDAACCTSVCQIDPTCCSVGWDAECVSLALKLCTTSGRAPDVIINELRTDQPGADNDEYFELKGAAATSLNGVTYIVIGDGTGGSGIIEAVVDLDGQSIPADGHYLVAESTFTLLAATPDLLVGASGLNFENSDNVTHMLVFNFTGALGQDLDTNDDGVLDATPWETEMDRIALVLSENPPTGTEFHYGPPSIGPEIDGKTAFVPGHGWRCENTGSWNIGQFELDLDGDTVVDSDDTPGVANDICAVKPTGACCLEIGCAQITSFECTKSGGDYLGDGTDCKSSPCPLPCPDPACPSNLDGVGGVTTIDLGFLLAAWSLPDPTTSPGCGGLLPCCADLNGDGRVNSIDLGQLLGDWEGLLGGDPDCP